MKLPLVEMLANQYQGPSLEGVLIIGVQHILETTHAMFRSLYRLGLKPQNISILGKCYSSCREVYEEMLADGIDVDVNSFSYSSHSSFDLHFQDLLENFIDSRKSKINDKKIEKIIVLDDGGKCIQIIQRNMHHFAPLVAIEQTSAGYEAIRKISLSFPVINVARTSTKLKLESPMIAEAATERLLNSLNRSKRQIRKSLIIGGGAIGLAMQNRLRESEIYPEIYDINKPEDREKKLSDIIGDYDLIVGCTGKTSLPKECHTYLSPQAVLVSVSSSDREFDAVHLRKKLSVNCDCHQDLFVDDLLLVRSGFPVNFDGERENIDPQLIQLTIALMTAGILQGIEKDLLYSPGIIPLDQQFIDLVEDGFLHSVGSI